MAKPTFVQKYESADWNAPGGATAEKTLMSAVSILTNDVIVVVAATEGAQTLGLTENGSATPVEQYLNVGNARISVWTYTATQNESITVTVTTNTGTGKFGGCAFLFRDTLGVGVKNQAANTTGDPAVTLTGVTANSAIVMIVSDWNATTGTQAPNTGIGAFTPMTGYPGDGAVYGVFGGYYADVGSAGNKAIGQADPNGLDWTIAGVEVKGTAGGGVSSKPGMTVNRGVGRGINRGAVRYPTKR